MANAQLDQNSRHAITAVLNTDGATVTRITAHPTNHSISVNNGVGGSNAGNKYEMVDDNSRPVLWAVSNADGVTPVALYVNASGQLLIQST